MFYPWTNGSKHRIIQKKKNILKSICSKHEIGFRRKKIGRSIFGLEVASGSHETHRGPPTPVGLYFSDDINIYFFMGVVGLHEY